MNDYFKKRWVIRPEPRPPSDLPPEDVYSRATPGTYKVPSELKNFQLLSSTPLDLGNTGAVGSDRRMWQSDPSRIIYHGGKYHFWMIDGSHTYQAEATRDLIIAGSTTIPDNHKSWILYVNSDDGEHWNAVDYVPLGPAGSCCDLAIEQANVVYFENRFYLFSEMFTSNLEKYGTQRPGIACLVADSPEGPWKLIGDLMLEPSEDDEQWDSVRVVNPRHVFFDGKWFMYYKGYKKGRPTDNGVAISDSLTGPYTKYGDGPLIHGHGHFAWRYKHGIIMVAFSAWYVRNYSRILWTEDGVHFVPLAESDGTFLFGSLYCPYDPLFGEPVTDNPITTYRGLQSVFYPGTTGWDVEQIEWKFGLET